MKRMSPLALLLAGILLCLNAHAAADAEEPSLIIKFDHEALTKQVLEEFPDGLPFDRTGTPTDIEQARKFWQLLADRPIALGGEVTDLRQTLETISDETGLPLLYGKHALARIEAAEQKMRMVTINDSVQKTITILCRLAAVEKTLVSAQGLVILGPDDPDEPAELHAAPPQNTFRWRELYGKKIHKELGDDYDWMNPSEEELQRVLEIVAETRCDLIVVEPMTLLDFVEWFSRASQQNTVIDPIMFATLGEVPDFPPPEFDPDSLSEDVPEEPPGQAEELDQSMPTADEEEDTSPAEGGSDEDALPDFELPPMPDGVGVALKPPGLIQPVTFRFAKNIDALNAALESVGLKAVPDGNGLLIIPQEYEIKEISDDDETANSFRWRESRGDKIKEEFPDGYEQDMPPEDWLRLNAAILETRCDLTVAEEMNLIDFIDWFCRESCLNISAHPIVLTPSAASAGGLPPDAESSVKPDDPGDLSAEEQPAEEGSVEKSGPPFEDLGIGELKPPVGFPQPKKVKPVVFRNTKVRDVLNGVLEDFELKVVEGTFGNIRIVPRDLTKEELEELRRRDIESMRRQRTTDSNGS